MKATRSALLAAALAVFAAGARAGGGPAVVELFTSQGCYSCPPAEEFLGELAARPDVLALEFHVDYWDDLVYGSAGRWKDVFSSPAFTRRQVGYNKRIRGRPNVYTPQMVVGGRLEAVGSRRGEVLAAIDAVRGDAEARVSVALDGREVTAVALSGGAGASGAVWLVRFLEERETRVLAGENMGKSLVSHHVVRELRRVGDWAGGAATLPVRGFALSDGEGCAVLVQDDRHGPVLGAAACVLPGS